MAQNYKQPGDVLAVTAGATFTAGTPVTQGKLTGVPLNSGVSGDTIQLQICGVFELVKAAPLVITQGDRVFWSGTEVTKTTSDTPIGIAAASAVSAATVVEVLLYEAGAPPQAAALVDVSTTNASDLATAIALANALKTSHNTLLANLRAVGLQDA